jgi:hypothetical protein
MQNPDEQSKIDVTPSVVKAMIALDQNIYVGSVPETEKVKRRKKNKMAKASRKANRGR